MSHRFRLPKLAVPAVSILLCCCCLFDYALTFKVVKTIHIAHPNELSRYFAHSQEHGEYVANNIVPRHIIDITKTGFRTLASTTISISSLLFSSIAISNCANAAQEECGPNDKNFVELESGLKYRDLKVGSGPAPSPGDTVRVHYTGTLRNPFLWLTRLVLCCYIFPLLLPYRLA